MIADGPDTDNLDTDDPAEDDPTEARSMPRVQSYIEESMAYAAYRESHVEGDERIGFEEFLRRWPRD